MAKKKNKNNNNNGSNNNDDDHNDNNNNGGGGGSGGGEGNNDGGGKKESAILTVVLKVDLHCEGCAGKVVKAVRSFDGVESVRVGDIQLNKLTVVGQLDPVKLRDKVAEKTKRKVELVSPSPAPKKEKNNENDHPNNSGTGGEQKKQNQNQNQQKEEKSAANKKDEKKPKELPLTTAVFKVQWHCRGCIDKIHKIVSRTKGYVDMSIDKEKDLMTVKGAMDMKALADSLKEKLKRPVEIVPAKKESGGGEKGNNGNSNNADGGEKKDKGGGNGGNGGSGGNGKKGKGGGNGGGAVDCDGDDGYKVEGYRMEYGGQVEYPNPQYAYGPGYMVNYVHAPQLFSDENPNACVIM